jgi:hypothetical protein
VNRARQAYGRDPDAARGQAKDRRDRATATTDRPVGRQRVGLGGDAARRIGRTRDGDEGAVAAGLERASTVMSPASREFAPRLKAAVAASAELQERDALKSVSLAAAMTTALVARGVPDPTAALAGELGVLAFKRGYAEWSEGDRDAKDDLARYILAALDDLRAASASLG